MPEHVDERNEYDALIDEHPTLVEEEGGGDEYGALVEQEREVRVRGLQQTLQAALTESPDQVARDAETARQAGVPRETVARNREQAERLAQQRTTDYDRLIRDYDRLAEWVMEDPENARVSIDDLQTLQMLHGALRPREPDDVAGAIAEKRGLSWLTSAAPAAFSEGQKQVELAQIGYRQIAGRATEQDLERAAELERQITGDAYGASGWWEESLVEASRQLPILGGSLEKAVQRGALTGVGFGSLALAAGQVGPQVAVPEEVVTVSGATLTGLAVGARIGAGEFAFQLESGLAYREYRGIRTSEGQRIDEGAARMAALVSGAVSAGAEVVGLEVLARTVPGAERVLSKAGRQGIKKALKSPTVVRALSKLSQRYAGVIGTEAATEAVQEASQILGGELAKGLSEGEFEPVTLEEAIDRISAAAKAGAQATSILGAPGPSARFVADAGRARQARANQRTFEALGEAAEASETRRRAPERFREFVARVREGGPVENVHVPVERWDEYFQQQQVDPGQMAEEVLGDAKQYAEARATGGDLVIPVERYAEKLAPTEHHAGLAADMRLRAGDMTLREAEEFERRVTEAAAEGRREEPTEAEAGVEGAPSSGDRQVFEDVLGQLLNSGMERSAAEQQASLLQSAFRSLGERTGRDPFDLYQRYGLRIRREIPELLLERRTVEALDPLFERLRAGEIPSEREAQGPSIVEFLREEGGVIDEGGELAGRDPDAQLQPFQRRLVRPEGEAGGAMTLEEAAQRAAERGYFPEISPDSGQAASMATPDMLLEAIDRDLRGDPVFSEAQADANVATIRQQLVELSDYLDELGIDLEVTDNETARRILEGQLPPEADQARRDLGIEGADDETVVSQAADLGYEGTDAGEAQAWIEAVNKGLDMSQEARLQRAQEQGFDTSQVVYHGTAGDFGSFSEEFRGRSTRARSARQAFFFSDRPRIAGEFAELAQRRTEGEAQTIIPVYLRTDNPLVLEGTELDDIGFTGALERARSEGHDGLIVRNAQDSPAPDDVSVDGQPMGVDPNSMIIDSIMLYREGEQPAETVTNELNEIVTQIEEDIAEDQEFAQDLQEFAQDLPSQLDAYRQILEAWQDDPNRVAVGADRESDVHVVFEPSQVRSIHAAFDPEAVESEELLAQGPVDPVTVTQDVSEAIQEGRRANRLYRRLREQFDSAQAAAIERGESISAFLNDPENDAVRQQLEDASNRVEEIRDRLIEIIQPEYFDRRLDEVYLPGFDALFSDDASMESVRAELTRVREFAVEGEGVLEQAPVPTDEEIQQLRQRVTELEEELRTDDLTGLRNRRAFDEDGRLGWPTVGALDMDGLKKINDTFGHAVGDEAIRQVASVMHKLQGDRENVRFYRTGGDEFLARFKNQGEANSILAELQRRLEGVNVELEVEQDGETQTWVYEGIGLSYGVGPDEVTADTRANEAKQERERAGLREPAREPGPPRRARRASDRTGDRSAGGEQIELFQQGQPRLSAIHNLSEENLRFADELGGLAVPSIAIQKQGQSAISGFGEITLIGGRTLADPATEPVFEADAYSARFPRPTYPKVRTRDADRFVDAVRPWIENWNSDQGASVVRGEVFDYLRNTPDPDRLYSRLSREEGIQAMFLEQEHEISLEPETREPQLSEPFVATEAFQQWLAQARKVPEDWHTREVSAKQFEDGTRIPYYGVFDGDGNRVHTGVSTHPDEIMREARMSRAHPSPRNNPEAYREFSEAVSAGLNEFAEQHAADMVRRSEGPVADEHELVRSWAREFRELFAEGLIGDDGLVFFGKVNAIEQSIRRLEAGREYDPTESGAKIEEAMRGREAEFAEWLRRMVMAPYGDPRIKVKGRNRPYTLSNIVDSMVSSRIKGEENTLVFGTNQARAAGATRFMSIEQMRAQADESIKDPEEYGQEKERTEELASAWREAASEYFTEGSLSDPSRIDVWAAFDGAMRAIATALSTGVTPTRRSLERALRAEAFDVARMPDDVIEQGLEFARQLKNAPVPYFESKPQRAVPLSEFRGAVIPETASQQTREILARHGIEVREYSEEGGGRVVASRTEAIKELRAELADEVLFQRQPGRPRGRLRFTRGDDGQGRRFTIELMENADLSTFLHETGHFFLEVIGDLADDPEAPQSIKDDYAEILRWFGVSSRDEIGTEQHEQWARSFEGYLFEGRAPTPELQGAFARFRAWLVSIYRQIRALNVDLTDEVRGVMDRILATDEEIASAREEQNYRPLFDNAQSAGMTEAEFAEYQRLIEQARSEAEQDLSRRALNELRREERAWWKEIRARVRDEVEAEINADRGYQAMYFLQRGELPDGRTLPEGVEPIKLSREILVQRYGERFLRQLPRPFVYSKAGGVDPDHVAELFGFASGDELVRRLAELSPRRRVIEAETDQRMRERFGDMLTDGTMPERAMEAVHNERRTDLLMSEIRALGRQSGRRPQPAEVLKQSAERIIAQKVVAEIQPEQYRRAEAKAARRAFEAAARGDFETAYEAKQQQVFNHHLYREARRARQEVDRIVAYMSRFEQKRTRQRLAKAGGTYLEQIDGLMEQFEFRRNVSLRRIRQRQGFRAWVSERNDEGFDFAPDPEFDRFLEEAQRINYRELTFEALSGLRDSVKFIDHLARTKNRLLAEQRQRQINEAVEEMVSQIEANHRVREEEIDLAPGLKQRFKDFVSRAHAEHTKPEFLFEYLDNQALGPVWTYLFKPINDANKAELELMGQTLERFQEIWSGHTKAERRQWYTSKFHVEELGVTMNKANILSMALNWGNEQNRAALLEGYGWSSGQVEAVFQRYMTKKDWDAVQATWDLIDSLWPRIKALEEEVNGIAPEKVEASPVQTPFGEYAGGYYPLKYDTRLNDKAFRRLEREQSKDLFESNFARAATKKGHTIERVGSGGQKVRLDMSVATEHLHQAIHDVTHRKAIMDVDRLSQDPRVRSIIERTAGRQMYRQIRPWLQSVAREQWSPPNAIQDLLSRARTGATIANMGWKVTTAIVQPLGYFQSVDLIGEKYAWKGLQGFYSSPRQAWQFVRERSTMMQNRQRTFDRDIRDAGKRFERAGTMDGIRQSFFYAIGIMDMSVSIPTWIGAYRKAMDGAVDGIEASDEVAAIDYADQSVRLSQSAGEVKDLAGIQRHTELFKIFTMFYSYFNALYNMLGRRFRHVAEGRISRSRFVASMLYLWFVPSVLSELVAGRGPEDDEEWLDWAIRQEILYGLGSVVFIRDIANAALTPFGFQGSPAFDAPETTARSFEIPYKLLADEDISRADIKNVVMAVSYWGALPGRQMWITGEYAYDVLTGEDQPESLGDLLHDAAFGRPADER